MDEKILAELSRKMNALISLSLRQLVNDTEFDRKGRKAGVGEQVRFLHGFGLDSKDISEITGAPLSSVRTLLTPGRRT